MCGVPAETSAVARARWLAEISEALEGARDALIGLDVRHDLQPDAAELFVRIEAARLEVQLLRSSRSLTQGSNKGPEWMKTSAWTNEA